MATYFGLKFSNITFLEERQIEKDKREQKRSILCVGRGY